MKKANPLSFQAKCLDCLYFKTNKHPSHKYPCSQEGVKAYAIAPQCFFPDVSVIANTVQQFALLASTMNTWSNKQKRIAIHLLTNSAKYSKKTYQFGAKVYLVHNGTGEYASDYLSAYVLGYQRGYVVLAGSSDMATLGRGFIAVINPDSVISFTEWQKRKAKMKAENKINNPDRHYVKRITSFDAYEPPTIDQAPKEWKAKVKSVKKDIFDKVTDSIKMSGW